MRPRQKGVSFVNDWLDNLRAHLAEQLKVWEVPSAGICVVKDGKVLLCDGVGLKDNESQPATGDTLYQIASCSKAFTATAAADAGPLKASWTSIPRSSNTCPPSA